MDRDRSKASAPTDVLQAALNRVVEGILPQEEPVEISEEPQLVRARKQYQAVDAEELLRQAEEQTGADQLQTLDAKGLRRIIAAFDRKYKDNMALRMKYADQPEKFMDSEVDLDEQVKNLMQAASAPELYPILVESNVVPTLLSLLSHENGDIAGDVIEVFSELTDADAVEDSEEEGKALVEAMLESNAVELLAQRLTQLNEAVEEDAASVNRVLQVFQNLVEVEPKVASLVVEKTKVLKWLLGRIRVKEFDGNKLEASELLAILLQGNEANQRSFGEANGIDMLLMSIAPYKSKDPASAEEEEFIENCFDCLCSVLMLPANQIAFAKAEGVELMVLMLKQKRYSRYGAVKTLDFATTRCTVACERFVDSFGLKSLFSLFMGKAKVKGPRGERDVEGEVEERLISIISNLFQCLTKGTRRDRTAAKFVESEFEKCDRLFELYFRYERKVRQAEAQLQETAEDLELDEEDVVLARMEAGLYTVQQCCVIIGHLWATADIGLRKRTLLLLHQKTQTLEHVREYLREYYRSIGSSAGTEESDRQKRRVARVLMAMGVDIVVEEEARRAAELPPLPPADDEAPLPPELPSDDIPTNGHHPSPPAPPQPPADDDMQDGAPPLPRSPSRSPPRSSKRSEEDFDDAQAAPSSRTSGREASLKEREREREKESRRKESTKERERERGDKDREREKDKKRDRRDRDRERDYHDEDRRERKRDKRDRSP